jgi:peptidoglycan/xylan/chitin deacetylase (PgdA/CDA1 family)
VLPKPILFILEKLVGITFSLKNIDGLSGKNIAITIDDLPYHEKNGPKYNGFKRLKSILDLADKYNITLNLFVTGSRQNLNGLEINQLNRAAGKHLLANHGTYDCNHAKLNEIDLKNDLSNCQNLIDKCYKNSGNTLPKTKFYRPGCGWVTPTVYKISKSLNMKIVLGTIYPHDPYIPFSYLNYLYIITKLQNNDIIILHDRPWLYKTLEYLFQYLNKHNYNTISLDMMEHNYEYIKTSIINFNVIHQYINYIYCFFYIIVMFVYNLFEENDVIQKPLKYGQQNNKKHNNHKKKNLRNKSLSNSFQLIINILNVIIKITYNIIKYILLYIIDNIIYISYNILLVIYDSFNMFGMSYIIDIFLDTIDDIVLLFSYEYDLDKVKINT